MNPETIYEPIFKKHNLDRYKDMQAEVIEALINSDTGTVYISLKNFNIAEIRIYLKHIFLPLLRDLTNTAIKYHFLLSVGKMGETRMTVLRKDLTLACIQHTQETRRKISIYG